MGGNYNNIYYLINRFEWNENGQAIQTEGKVITSVNKGLLNLDEYPEIKTIVSDRVNMFLLGDSVDDVKMADNFKYQNLLKIGFLNFEYEKYIDEYKKYFDVIVESDGPMNKVTDLLKSTV